MGMVLGQSLGGRISGNGRVGAGLEEMAKGQGLGGRVSGYC